MTSKPTRHCAKQRGRLRFVLSSLAGLLALPGFTPLSAAPDLRAAETLAGLTVWPDHQIVGRYYHLPGRVELAASTDGRPRLDLMSTRYVGTAAAGDQGRREQYNRLSFTVVQTPPDPAALAAVRTSLRSRHGTSAELRPLPILRMPTRLVYQPIEDSGAEPTTLPKPSLEHQQARQSVWTERSYTLSVSAAEAQVLQDVLSRDGVRFSLTYGLVVRGVGNATPLHELSGSPELVAEMRSALAEGDQDDATVPRPLLIAADATSVTADLQRWPGLVSRFDLNEQLPPGFGALEVRCYDFQQIAAGDLFEVRVDIRARTVAGNLLVKSVIFSSLEPESFASNVRFPVAVRLDRPYAYRVTRIGIDGQAQLAADWTQRESWTDLLDVTRPSPSAIESSSLPSEEAP